MILRNRFADSRLGLRGWTALALLCAVAHGADPAPPAASAIHANAIAPREAPAFHLETFPDTSAFKPEAAADTGAWESLARYVQVRSAGFAGWADTGIYIATQMGRWPQLHRVAAPGADRRQLTFFRRRMSIFDVNPRPDRAEMLCALDEGGNEEFRLRLHDLRSGEDKRLGMPQGRAEGLIWNDSGTAFAYGFTPAGTDRWDIRLGRTDGRDTLVLSRPGSWTPLDLSPDGKWLLVQKYVSASESEVYVIDLDGGGVTPLLPGDKRPAAVDRAVWVRAEPAEKEKARSVSRGTGGAGSAEAKTRSAPARTGGAGATDLNPKGPDGWDVCFTSDRDGEFTRLYRIHPGAAGPEALSPSIPWDVEWVEAAPDRRTLVYAVNEDGFSRLYLLTPDGPGHPKNRAAPGPGKAAAAPEPRLLTGIPDGVISGVKFKPEPAAKPKGTAGGVPTGGAGPAGAALPQEPPREFGFTLLAATFPGDAFTYDMRAGKATRWTRSETGGIPEVTFRSPQLVRYPSFDSLMIPAWLYLPDPKTFPAPRPVLVQIHGGPEMQARPGFDAFLQFLVGKLGIAVVQPNVRGSSGYGKTRQKADDGYLRMNSVKDIGALLDWIAKQPGLDAKRMAVSGRSYGGFMSLSALVEYGDRLRAGVCAVGISHFPSFLKKTSGYRRDLRRAEYGDERDPRMASFLDSISPLTRVDRMHTPLLLCHGRNDPRVPFAESEHIFAALKARKVPVWFLSFSEEGHAVRDQESQMVQDRVTAEFLTRQLGIPAR